MAKLSGMDVEVIQLCAGQNLKGDTKKAFEYASSSGVNMRPFTDEPLNQNSNARETVIVDAILGTGINRPVDSLYQKAIVAVNSLGWPIISVDLPSGLNSDTGCAMGIAVRARLTVTFVGLKQGLFTGEGQEYSG